MPKYQARRRDAGELYIKHELEADTEEEAFKRLENGEGDIVEWIFRPTNEPQKPELFSFKQV